MRETEAKERTKEREDKESLESSLSKDNNDGYCGSGEIPVRISVEDDPVTIAVKLFNGTDLNRHYWRWYLDHMIMAEADIDKAEELFSSWVYDKKRTLVADGTPDIIRRKGEDDIEHFHARCFHKFLKAMFRSKYGIISRGGAQ